MTDDRISFGRGSSVGACPSAEEMAAYLDGTLSTERRTVMETHLLGCADCRAIMADAIAVGSATADVARSTGVEPIPFAPRKASVVRRVLLPLLATAALLVVGLRVFVPGVLAPWTGGSAYPELSGLVAALDNGQPRPVEGRLVGGFAYAPLSPVLRGPDGARIGGATLPPEAQVAVAAIEARNTGNPDPGPASKAALAVALLVDGSIDEAIATLTALRDAAPQDAERWNDLAVAYLARGVRDGAAADFREARMASDRALELRPGFHEALFNRALSLEHLGERQDAIAAWSAVQRADPQSAWAAEATSRIATLARTP